MRLNTVLNKKQPDCLPVWIMRQAGRYMPEYRALRKKVGDFKQLYQTAELAAQITLLPVEKFNLDAAIIFSDILIALDNIGLGVKFIENKGPCITYPLRTERDLTRLGTQQTDYEFLIQAIKITKKELTTPLIGFVGSPWTLAVYAVEGQGSKNFCTARKILYQNPQFFHQLLLRLTQETTNLARLQIQHGADVIQIFDSWAGLLPPSHYEKFSLSYIRLLIRNLKQLPNCPPLILYARNCSLPPAVLAKCGIDVLSLDWQCNLKAVFEQLGDSIILQGNLDPASLYAGEELLGKAVDEVLAARPPHCHHIFNLGHGIYPDTSPHKVRFLVDRVHNH